MKTYRTIFAIILLIAYAKSNAQFNKNTKKEIVIGVADSLYSEVLEEQRELWIHLPEDFDTNNKYPVIYVLDASQNFYSVVGMMTRLLPWRLPKSIVVGVRNTDRQRDFTPTNVPFHRGRESKTSGSASNFLKFVNEELKPFINSKYPTEDMSTVVGHSLAGLFVVYTYLNSENTFDSYVAIDPSLWWDNENLLRQSENLIKDKNLKDKSLYVAVANSLGKDIDTVQVRNDKSVITEQMRANLKFHDILVKNKKQLDFNWEFFNEEDHGSVVVPAQFNGLRSVFSWFPFPELWRFNTPNSYTVDEMIDPYYRHYKKLSQKMKRDVKPDWALVNDIGLLMLEGPNSPEKALAFHQMNLRFYPDEAKSYEALGDYYISQKEKLIAIEYYKKAYQLDANSDAKAKLDKLKK